MTEHIPHHVAAGDCPCCSCFFRLRFHLILLRRPHLLPLIPVSILFQVSHSILVQSSSAIKLSVVACGLAYVS